MSDVAMGCRGQWFPAHAGMNRNMIWEQGVIDVPVPRTRGDEPDDLHTAEQD